MNLAIIIAISKYNNPANNLPACMNDSILIGDIIQESGRFESILKIDQQEPSSKVKRQLAEFVKTHQGKEVSEVFFYYTGHGGIYDDDDFFFVLSDFDEKKARQTGLSNNELDTLLRSLTPQLAVKVVDACHSAVTYVKQGEMIAKAMDASKGNFKQCYFMFSSQREQSSFADSNLSYFTKEIVSAVANHTETEIRYKDIIDVLSDAFMGNKDQKPMFVVQADCTDLFCSITPGLIEKIKNHLTPQAAISSITATGGKEEKEKLESRLASLIEEDAKNYANLGEALAAFTWIETELAVTVRPEMLKLYKRDIELIDSAEELPNLLAIANWLKEQGEGLFASLTYQKINYTGFEQIEKPPSGPLYIRGLFPEYVTKEVTKTRYEINGFAPTLEQTPYVAIRLGTV